MDITEHLAVALERAAVKSSAFRRRIVAQAHNPTGPAGHVQGWIFGHRSSNVRRNRWAVELLNIKPGDRVIEFGCGPGVAVSALAGRATQGLVVGVDHSAVMLRQAQRRNAKDDMSTRVRGVAVGLETGGRPSVSNDLG